MIGEFLEFLGISFGFPFIDFQPLKAWHSLHLGTDRYMTKPGGTTFSCMRPLVRVVSLVMSLVISSKEESYRFSVCSLSYLQMQCIILWNILMFFFHTLLLCIFPLRQIDS